MSLKDYEIIQCLRDKEKYLLLKVKRKIDGLFFLIKHVNFKFLNKKERENAFNETKLLSMLKHPNIIELKQSNFNNFKNTLNLVLDFGTIINLKNKIEYAIKCKGYQEENTIWEVLTQILIGLNYLHRKGLVHRNLQAKNIYISKFRLIKITDFNCCNIHNKNMSLNQPLIITSLYTAPELLKKQKFNYKCDIWSLGCIIYEMASLSLPFKNYSEICSKNLNDNISFKPIPDFYSNNLKSIIKDMLTLDLSKRPSTTNLLNYHNVKETAKKLGPIYTQYKNNINLNNIYIKNMKTAQNINPNLDNRIQMLKTEGNINKNQIKLITMQNSRNNTKLNLYAISKGKKLEYKINGNKDIFQKKDIKKSINNATYRTLKERKLIFTNSSQRNCLSQKKSKNINNDDYEIYNYRIINPKDNKQNSYSIGAFSFANTNINKFLNGKFIHDFQKPQLVDNYISRNNLKKMQIVNFTKDNSSKAKILKEGKTYNLNNNLSYVRALKNEKNQINANYGNVNHTDIREIRNIYGNNTSNITSTTNSIISKASGFSKITNNYEKYQSQIISKATNKTNKNLNNNYIKANNNFNNLNFSNSGNIKIINNVHSNILNYNNIFTDNSNIIKNKNNCKKNKIIYKTINNKNNNLEKSKSPLLDKKINSYITNVKYLDGKQKMLQYTSENHLINKNIFQYSNQNKKENLNEKALLQSKNSIKK